MNQADKTCSPITKETTITHPDEELLKACELMLQAIEHHFAEDWRGLKTVARNAIRKVKEKR